MRVVDTIYIEAPPEVVWRVTEEIERWPEWAPSVTSVSLVAGSRLRLGTIARIKQPGQPVADWIVTEHLPGRRFEWKTRRAGFRMIGVHTLRAEGTGTRNELELRAEGVMARIMWPVLRHFIGRALRDENQGLRTRCEDLVKQRRSAAPDGARP